MESEWEYEKRKTIKQFEGDTLMKDIGFIILVIILIFELALFGFAWFAADKVECNYLWCTFTISSEETINQAVVVSSDCSINGEPVNCSAIDTNINLIGLVE